MKFLTYYNERKDIKSSNEVLLLMDKIVAWLNKINKLSDVLPLKDNYWTLPVKVIDKRYSDLWIFIGVIKKSFGKYSTVGGAGPMKDGKNYGITLDILEDIQEIDDPMFVNWFSGRTRIRMALVHELKHYMDMKKYKTPIDASFIAVNKIQPETDAAEINARLEKYFNLPDEINARWHEATVEILRGIKIRKPQDRSNFKVLYDFNVLRNAMEVLLDKSFLASLTPENKKLLLKRMYAFWTELKEWLL